MAARLANRETLDSAIEEATVKYDTASLIAMLSAAGISAGRVHDLASALASPVAQELDLFVEGSTLERPKALPMQRTPIDPDGTGMRRPPPRLGEHTSEVLAELDGLYITFWAAPGKIEALVDALVPVVDSVVSEAGTLAYGVHRVSGAFEGVSVYEICRSSGASWCIRSDRRPQGEIARPPRRAARALCALADRLH